MSEVTATLERTADVENTSEELRWRMDQVIRATSASGEGLCFEAAEFNKALAILRQGDAD